MPGDGQADLLSSTWPCVLMFLSFGYHHPHHGCVTTVGSGYACMSMREQRYCVHPPGDMACISSMTILLSRCECAECRTESKNVLCPMCRTPLGMCLEIVP